MKFRFAKGPLPACDPIQVALCTVASLFMTGCETADSTAPGDAEWIVERLSQSSDGQGGNVASGNGLSISGDGMLIVFDSEASNLVPDDNNDVRDIFLANRHNGTITRISTDTQGAEGNGPSSFPTISANGTTVAFSSEASNLTLGDNNGLSDWFILDISSGETLRVAPAHGVDVSLSENGQLLAFGTIASLDAADTNNAPDAYVLDRASGSIEWISEGLPPLSNIASMNASGRWITLTTGLWYALDFQLWLYDQSNGVTRLIDLPSSSVCPQHGELSADGQTMIVVACPEAEQPFTWTPWVINLSGTLEVIEALPGIPQVDYSIAQLSADGNHALVSTSALKPDVYAELVSVELASGELSMPSSPSDGAAYRFDMSDDGSVTVFTSTATDLIPMDTNGVADVFVRSLQQQ